MRWVLSLLVIAGVGNAAADSTLVVTLPDGTPAEGASVLVDYCNSIEQLTVAPTFVSNAAAPEVLKSLRTNQNGKFSCTTRGTTDKKGEFVVPPQSTGGRPPNLPQSIIVSHQAWQIALLSFRDKPMASRVDVPLQSAVTSSWVFYCGDLPCKNAEVTARNDDASFERKLGARSLYMFQSKTDSQGRVTIRGIPTVEWKFAVSLPTASGTWHWTAKSKPDTVRLAMPSEFRDLQMTLDDPEPKLKRPATAHLDCANEVEQWRFVSKTATGLSMKFAAVPQRGCELRGTVPKPINIYAGDHRWGGPIADGATAISLTLPKDEDYCRSMGLMKNEACTKPLQRGRVIKLGGSK